MKNLIKFVLAVAILAAGALTVLFEVLPESAATAAVAPYCEGPYLIAKARAVALYGMVCERLKKSDAEPPAAEAEANVLAQTVAATRRATEDDASFGGGESPKVRPSSEVDAKSEEGVESSDGTPKAPPTLAKAHWYTRKSVSESFCRGKVTVVCVWNEELPEGLELLAQAQRIADGFGNKKDLVVFASHRGGRVAAAKTALARAQVTIPVCENAGLPCALRIAGTPPYFYLVDKKGTLKYVGRSDKAVLTKMSELF